MSKKKTVKKTVKKTQTLWMVISMFDELKKLEDFNDCTSEIFTSSKDALESFEPNDYNYVVEVKIQSIKTDPEPKIDNLREIKIK